MMKYSAKHVIHKFSALINRGLLRFIAFYQNMPIRIKLMLVLNIVILFPLLTIGFSSYKDSEQVLKNKSIQYSQDILKIINLRVSDYITGLDTLSRDMLGSETFTNYITNDINKNDSLEIYHDMTTTRQFLKDQIRSKGKVQSISISVGGRQDLYCFADDYSQRQSIDDVMPYNGDIYKQIESSVRAADGAPVFYFDSENGKVKNIFYARAIINRDTFETNGMIVFLVSKDWFNTVFDGLINVDMKKTAVLSPDGQVILGKSGAEDYPLSKELLKSMSYSSGWISDKAQNTLISYVTVDNFSWKIASYIPLSVLYSDVEYIKERIVLVLIFAVLFMLLVSFYISYDFVYSINKLVGGMKRLQKGEENVRVILHRKDELGFMGDSFNTMVTEITTLQDWVLREKLTRRDAQIRALQSQINPHFLFNTLESINWMAQLSGVSEISETVTALAALMEASTARSGKTITLEEEFSYIDNYILILKKRFEGRIELKKEVTPGVLGVRVPRLLIQPLVENAANHGLANFRGNGVVRIAAVQSGERVRITVEDNGMGIDPDELSIINERLQMNDDEYFRREEEKRTRGIGLENVNRRIKLFYGAQYGVRIESEKGSFTRIYVEIPLEVNDRTEDKPEEQLTT